MIEFLTLEAHEVFKLLEEAGMNPQWCDPPVPYYDACVQAGLPTDPGDIPFGEQLMMAQDLAKGGFTFCFNVKGDSMKDADIHDGDRVELMTGAAVRDGDIVVAEIDKREYTLKSFCKDEQGNMWLVPANTEFKPLLLTEEMDVRILGKVIRVFKEVPCVPYAELLKIVNRTKSKMMTESKAIPAERIEQIICEMGNVVKHGRQWYAVYRTMVDKGVLDDGEYGAFCKKVMSLLPMHGHLPEARELRRMAVQSFRKAVCYWKEEDAPVSGMRFDDYLRIAQLTKEKMAK